MRLSLKIFGLIVACLTIVGCAYTTQSELPENIKTIEVLTFGNSTYYNQLEGDLTREIIKAINLSPRFKVVNKDADAVLSGDIFSVTNTGLEYDKNYQPASMKTVISAKFSLYDNKEGYFVINKRSVASNKDSSTAGNFNSTKSGAYANANEHALAELAQTIVRSMVSNW